MVRHGAAEGPFFEPSGFPSPGEGEQTQTCCSLLAVCCVGSSGLDSSSDPHPSQRFQAVGETPATIPEQPHHRQVLLEPVRNELLPSRARVT